MSRSFGGRLRDVALADADRALVDALQAGEHAQRRRLAAAGRADQHQELAVGDLQVELVDGRALGARVVAARSVEGHSGHGLPFISAGQRPHPVVGPVHKPAREHNLEQLTREHHDSELTKLHFTPPAVRPETRCFSISAKSATTGRMPMIETAKTYCQADSYWPMNRVSATVSGWLVSVGSRIGSPRTRSSRR